MKESSLWTSLHSPLLDWNPRGWIEWIELMSVLTLGFLLSWASLWHWQLKGWKECESRVYTWIPLLTGRYLRNPWLLFDGPFQSAFLGFPGGVSGKESTCQARDLGFIPGLRRSPGGGHGNILQYSCLENSMNRGAWWTAVHRVAELDMTEMTWHSPVQHNCPLPRGSSVLPATPNLSPSTELLPTCWQIASFLNYSVW